MHPTVTLGWLNWYHHAPIKMRPGYLKISLSKVSNYTALETLFENLFALCGIKVQRIENKTQVIPKNR